MICSEVDESIEKQEFLNHFRMSGLPFLSEMLEKFLTLLVTYFILFLNVINASYFNI